MSNTPPFSVEKTLPMTVANTGFMLDRLGQDCSPLQFLRELTQNAIEAIVELPEAEGEIIWDVDWNTQALTGQYKLCVIDTGVGMTGEEMFGYINRLSSSAHPQSHVGNFGVGAKIAAATRNHEGLIYLSWKDGIGSMIHLWRDPATAQYGLRQFELQGGRYTHVVRVEDAVKPDVIQDHGTMVILQGSKSEQNTMLPPEGSGLSSGTWITKYLNTRYFRFPAGVTVKARTGWELPQNDRHNFLRTINGQGHYLDSNAQAKDQVVLDDGATVHWWILSDEKTISTEAGRYASGGHTAALYQDELYELTTGRAGVARLQMFGIIFGYQRVVLYVEPQDSNDVQATTSRTELRIKSEVLPWAEWAAEFRERMPSEIKELMEEVTQGAVSKDHHQAIKDRLKQVRELYAFSKYRPTRDGDRLIDPDDAVAGGRPEGAGERDGEHGRSGGTGGRAGNIYSLFLTDEGVPGEGSATDNYPKVDWVTVANGKRQPEDMEDRAAKFLPELNQLLINGDFRVFSDMIQRWCDQYPGVAGARDTIQEVVREWFEQSLVEAVLGAQALRNSRRWTMEDIAKLWTEEALTTAVLPRYHVDHAIHRAVASKLGSTKERVS